MQQVWVGVLSLHRIRRTVFRRGRIQTRDEKIHLFFRSQKNVVFTRLRLAKWPFWLFFLPNTGGNVVV